MPWTPDTHNDFEEAVRRLADNDRKRLLRRLAEILSMDNPHMKGGRMRNGMWTYQFEGRWLIVCQLDVERMFLLLRALVKFAPGGTTLTSKAD